MINLVRVLIVSLITLSLSAQNVDTKAMAMNEFSNAGVFEFENETIDYGIIEQNSDGKRSFKFKNTGNSPIIISKVKGSCGCTVATKPSQPIMPGESAEIGVAYATNRVGKFSKSITITSNASESRKVIKIKGNVLPSKQEKAKTTVAKN